VSVFWLVVGFKSYSSWFDANNGNQPMDSETNITVFNAFNNAALVDCCFLCFDSNVCRQFLYLLCRKLFVIVDPMVDTAFEKQTMAINP
jgi:hypothetical protein